MKVQQSDKVSNTLSKPAKTQQNKKQKTGYGAAHAGYFKRHNLEFGTACYVLGYN